MKSIMEEASSISKAIEKGWIKAGQPKEFSVKIFEEAQKNFFGMTVKPAKIAILFNDVAPEPVKQKNTRQNQSVSEKQKERPVREQRQATKKDPVAPKQLHEAFAPEKAPMQTQSEEYVKPVPTTPVWSDAMAEDAQNWLKDILQRSKLDATDFHTQVQHFHLRIQFPKPVFEDQNRQKQFFSGLATLVLQMLKQKYRRPLKGYKIILTSD